MRLNDLRFTRYFSRADRKKAAHPALVSKKQFCPSLDNHGFSIPEIMVAGSVLMVMLVGVTSMINFSNRSVQSVKTSTDFNSLVTLLQSALNSANTCKATMSGISFSPLPTSTAPITVTSIKTEGGMEIAKIGSFGNSLKITRLEFNNATSNGINQYLANFHLEADKVLSGGAVGGKTLSHDFQISVKTDANSKISDCSGSASSDSLWQKAASGTDIYYSNGKVGIGTASPQNTFEVMDDITVRSGTTCNSGETAVSYKTTAQTCNGWGCNSTNCTTGSHDWQASLDSPSPRETCGFKSGGVSTWKGCTGAYTSTCYAISYVKCKSNTPLQRFSIGDGQIKLNSPVGIGTNNPAANLHINSDSPPFGIRITNSTGAMTGLYIGTDSTSSFISNDRGSLKLRVGNADRMTIDAGGSVGIGTTSPGAELHIDGTSELLRLTSTGFGTLFAGSDANQPWFGTSTNNDLRLITNSVEKMRITSSGNVGIGTTNPTSTLHVNGTVYAKVQGATAGRSSTGYAMINPDGRIGPWNVGASYIEVILDNTPYGVSVFLSDKKHKSNIHNSTYNATADIQKMSFKSFHNNLDQTDWEVGLIAQDLEEINKNYVNKLSDGTLMPNIGRLISLALKSIQEIKSEKDREAREFISSVKELYSKFTEHDQTIAIQSREIASMKIEAEKAKAEAAKANSRADRAENELAAIKAYLCGKGSGMAFCK